MSGGEILPGVRECLASALDIDASGIGEDDTLVNDLGADSLDFLDIIFHLERRFEVSLTPREIERRAKEALGGEPFEVDGIYTPAALDEIRKALPEIPGAELPEGLAVAELPRRFRVATLVNLVRRAREATGV